MFSYFVISTSQLEAANVGGQLVAEKLKIPSVLLAPHSMLALVAEKTAPSNGLVSLFRRRRDSFALGRRFMQMNKVRQCQLYRITFSFRILQYTLMTYFSNHLLLL